MKSKKIWLILLVVLIAISLFGCENKTTNNELKESTEIKTQTEVKKPEKSGPVEISVEEFSKIIDGCWVEAKNANYLDYDAGYSFSFYTFENGTYWPAWYPGSIGRESVIKLVFKDGDNYILDVYLPETTDLSGEETIEAEYVTVELTLKNGNLTFSGDSGTYIRTGDSFDEALARAKIREYKGGSAPGNDSSSESSWDTRIKTGMSRTQVESMWGKPYQTSTKYDKDGVMYIWCWYHDIYGNSRMLVYDSHNVVYYLLGEKLLG